MILYNIYKTTTILYDLGGEQIMIMHWLARARRWKETQQWPKDGCMHMFNPGRSISLPSRRRPCNGLSLSLAAVRFPRDSLVFFPPAPAHTAISGWHMPTSRFAAAG